MYNVERMDKGDSTRYETDMCNVDVEGTTHTL